MEQPIFIVWYQVDFINYLKNTYGKDLKQAMFNQLTGHCHTVAQETLLFGLEPQTIPNFYKAFDDAGGDSDYLQYAVQCFLEVRHEILKVQRGGHA